jgi:hypothetical protein
MSFDEQNAKLVLEIQRLQEKIGVPIGPIERIIVGILAGLAAVCVKILRQDLDSIRLWWMSTRPEDIVNLQSLFLSYYVLIPVLMFLGGVLCWLGSDETSKIKLFAMGIAAPAIITTLAGGPKEPSRIPAPPISAPGPAGWLEQQFVTVALAQTNAKDNCASMPSLLQGFRIFFGEPNRYYVIVAGYKSKAAAEAKAKEVNQEDATMKAFVGKRKPCNEYYPVVVGDYLTEADANKLLVRAKKLDAAEDPYLSDYPDRKLD